MRFKKFTEPQSDKLALMNQLYETARRFVITGVHGTRLLDSFLNVESLEMRKRKELRWKSRCYRHF